MKDCDLLKGKDDLKKQLLEAWRAENGIKPKKKRGKGMRNMALEESGNQSTLFRAKFAESIEANVLAVYCADDKLMPSDIFQRLQAYSPRMNVELLSDPLEYNMAVDAKTATGTAKVVCDRIVTADAELHIRRGTTLLLRNVEWAMSKHAAQNVLIGRPLLEALGMDTRAVLEATCEKHSGIVNVPSILYHKIDPKDGTLAKFTRDKGMFHSQHGDD